MTCCASRGEQAELVSIHFSPWSLKVKWALAHAEIDYTVTEKPMLEFPLRWRLGIPANETTSDGSDGKLTFPILVLKDGSLIRQSLDIAKWSHRQAVTGKGLGGQKPGEWNDAIDAWDEKATQLMRFGRQVGMDLAVKDDEKCIMVVKMLGLPIPGDTLKLKVGRAALSSFNAKYAEEHDSSSREQAKSVLDALHEQLQKGTYLVDGKFTYADVTMILGLHCIRPFKEELPSGFLGEIMSDALEDLATQYEPLYTWAHDILSKHLPKQALE
mmetsp:Transcript_61337/g.142725  ORF Transcript_61337/g.142725 Transcript_61337/m.142725 type:complete len:271 (-) Transcript_61337:56-868(-)|eukprot:CAMPEP_0171109030 /NCGR_PEP_ID=MMETSP0766_2-20121228/70133_1 /TAXON_ID=439317 /ORGANISM="Gambierdiscus australes, Strain CAWD 149" /LENGTH=270 /DNA_ID=CAMNT_0011570681 /DNA_START=72 /DNA_END=884 /DNA_ORIENTATION=+